MRELSRISFSEPSPNLSNSGESRMSIFEISRDEIKNKADFFLGKVNQDFDIMLAKAKTDYRLFWSNPEASIEIIRAMGTSAEAFFSIAYARVQMLIQIATIIGNPGLVNIADLLPPYTLTFKTDGSLNQATPK